MAAYLLILGIAFLILPRGPINPLYGLVWLRGPALVVAGLAALWLAGMSLSPRAALVAHGLAALPVLAVAAEYFNLANYGPAVTLLLLGGALAVSPLVPQERGSTGLRGDLLGLVLGASLAAQGIVLLVQLGTAAIPFGLQLQIGILDIVFGASVAACHLFPKMPAIPRLVSHLGAGLTTLSLYAILALGYGHILWILDVSTLLVAGAFMLLPWLSGPLAGLPQDSVRMRFASGLFNAALIPILIAVPLVLASVDGVSLAVKQTSFGVAIGLGILAAVAGWVLARALATPLTRLAREVEHVAAGIRPVGLVAHGPREVKELAVAVRAMSNRIDRQIDELKEARDAHKSIAERLQHELQVPLAEFPGLEVGLVYHSATELAQLGGDFYDVFPVTGGRVGVILGDVSGRGLDAAAQAVVTRASLRAFSRNTASPGETLAHANSQLIDGGFRGFVTVFFGILDLSTGELVYSMAGHPPPVLATGGHAVLQDVAGPILGVFADATFHEARLHLDVGDTFVLYTDGLTETKQHGELFGEQRLVAEVEALRDLEPADLAQELHALAADYAGGVLRDDLAVLTLRLQNLQPTLRP